MFVLDSPRRSRTGLAEYSSSSVSTASRLHSFVYERRLSDDCFGFVVDGPVIGKHRTAD